MNTRISNLPSGSLTGSDYIPFDGPNGTKKFSGQLIEDKANKSDIVDNLTTNDATKMLSAKQGKALNEDKADRADVIPLINIWDEQWENGYWDTTTGQKTPWTNVRSASHIPCKPNTQYYLHCSVYTTLLYYDSNKNFIVAYGNYYDQVFTTPNNAYYLTFYTIDTYTTYNNDISINYPSTYHGYYPSALPRTNAHVGGLGNAIGMMGWNQLCKNGNFADTSEWSPSRGTLSISGNVASITANDSWATVYKNYVYDSSHKYLLIVDSRLTSNVTRQIGIATNGRNTVYDGSEYHIVNNNWQTIYMIFSTTNGSQVNFNCVDSVNGDVIQFRNAMLIDLTALFGAGNEPSSVEDFRAMFPADYYPYCSGSFGDLLWENASPSSAFGAQDINLDLSKYNFVYIYFRNSTPVVAPKGFNCNSAFTTTYCGNRSFNVSSNGIYFSDGINYTTYGSWTSTVENDYGVPIKIYGVR